MKLLRRLLVGLIAVVVSVSAPLSVSALTEEQLQFYSQNGILFYNPSGSAYCVGNNQDYNGNEVWAQDDLKAIETFRPFYEKAADKYGFPWQILAVLHYREYSLQRSNPSNGQGIYQLYSYTRAADGKTLDANKAFLPAGKVSDDEFQRQTDIAASIVAGKASGMDLDNLSDGDIQRIFYYYNGTGNGKYAEKGRLLNLSEEEIANGGGSPYVMNRFDAKRDPNNAAVSPYWVGTFTGDGVYDSGANDMRYGAFVLYAAIANSGSCNYAGGSIAETALLLSWEGLRSHDKNDPKPEYVRAMNEVGTYSSAVVVQGASCDQFVSTVMRYSGADPDYPVTWPPTQKAHMDNHPEMYEKVNANGDFSLLQPGDIFVTTNNGNHIYIYVGEIDGKMTQASASSNERTAEHYSGAGAVYFTDTYVKDSSVGRVRYYEVYRRVNY